MKLDDPRRTAILEAGRCLDELGGYDAMCAAQRNLYPDGEGRTMAAGMHMNHLWSGIGSWQG